MRRLRDTGKEPDVRNVRNETPNVRNVSVTPWNGQETYYTDSMDDVEGDPKVMEAHRSRLTLRTGVGGWRSMEPKPEVVVPDVIQESPQDRRKRFDQLKAGLGKKIVRAAPETNPIATDSGIEVPWE